MSFLMKRLQLLTEQTNTVLSVFTLLLLHYAYSFRKHLVMSYDWTVVVGGRGFGTREF